MAENIPSISDLVTSAREIFKKEFNEDSNIAVYAPGRVNIIGEHTDYNDGFVMPMALPLVTVIVGKKVEGDTTIITANQDADLPRKITFPMGKAFESRTPKWANYVKGVIAYYIGSISSSFNAVILSSVPTGGGLSSSAALEVAMYTFLDALNGPNIIMPTDKALACQKAEHDYAGMPCGIMDQFISVMAKKDTLLLIDCRNLTSTLIPLLDPNIVILITNSNVKHELTGSEYSSRRKQCQEAALLMGKCSLRDARMDDLEKLKETPDSTLLKRARHVISEIERTQKAAELLKQKQFEQVGQLMTESHKSLKDDFEVSCPELDQLVEIALKVNGVLGSRMTGGGFGGCTVTMVYGHAVNDVIDQITNNYAKKATFYVCKPSDGAQILEA